MAHSNAKTTEENGRMKKKKKNDNEKEATQRMGGAFNIIRKHLRLERATRIEILTALIQAGESSRCPNQVRDSCGADILRSVVHSRKEH